MLTFKIFVRATQTILVRGGKIISFAEVWSQGCCSFVWRVINFEMSLSTPQSNKKRGEMTLFSLHHNSNFLRLVPPALWRDPRHCAGSRRRKTERITHPGKTDWGVIVLSITLTHTCTLSVFFIYFFYHLKNVCTVVGICVRDSERERERHVLSMCTGKDDFYISTSGRWLGDLMLNLVWPVFGTSQSPHSHVDHREPPIHLLTMDDEGQGLAKSPQLHPPFLLSLS